MQQPSPSRSKTLIRRHSLLVRVTHWVNALCFAVLLISGLQIFNAHPRLYVGLYGADHEQPVFEIGNRQQQGFVRLGSLQLNTTGVLGVSKLEGTLTARAFPGWLTLPSWRDLGAGRHWHFFFAWLLLFNGVIYLLHGFWHRHFRRDLLPNRQQLDARHLWQEICDHARLRVTGLVQQPLSLSLSDLQRFPSRTQITRHDCVEGWSAIGKWQGVPLGLVLDAARLRPGARYVVFLCADELEQTLDGSGRYYESIDLQDAWHPQTLLAYRMNDQPLPVAHGAPLRLRVERQLGYKHAKYLMEIKVVDSFAQLWGGRGGYWEDRGYEWYGGI